MSSFLKHAVQRLPPLHRAVTASRRLAQRSALHVTERLISRHGSYEILVVFGMRRSGNHLSISWILDQVDGSAAFYNNINPDLHPFTGRMTETRLRAHNPSPRLVLSYEDVTTSRLLSRPLLDFLADRQRRHGARVRFALILRDPYNLFASRIKKWPDRFAQAADIAAQQAIYLDHAALAANPAPIWQDAPLIPVLYNDLVSDPATRRKLSDQLGIRQGDRGLDVVPVYGHGSSFDGRERSGTDVRDQVFSRWKEMQDDPRFRAVTGSDAIRAAGQDIFGFPAPR